MRPRPAGLIALLVILPAIAQSPPTLADATVIQDDGWTHRHVTVEPLAGGASLRITRVDGEMLVLPVTAVATVRDATGRDVTHLYVPGVEPPPPTIDAEPGDPDLAATQAARVARRPELKPFTATLGGGLGYGQTSGKFYDGLDDGRAIYADARFALGPRHYLKLCCRVQDVFDGQVNYVDRDNGYTTGVAPATAEIRQYLVTVGVLSGATEGNLLRAYAELGFGFGDHVITITEGPVAGSESEGRILTTLQGGVLVPFGSSSVGLDLGLSVIAKLVDGNSGEGHGFVVGGQAGLVLLFGRDR